MNPSGQDNSGFALPGGIYRNDAPANGDAAGQVVLDLPESGAWKIRIGNVAIEALNTPQRSPLAVRQWKSRSRKS